MHPSLALILAAALAAPVVTPGPFRASTFAQEPAAESAHGAASADEKADAGETGRLERDLASFDHVWQTVRNRHWDPQMGGVDWDAVRAELRPRVEASASTDEARQVMQEMLLRLAQSHYAIIPATAYDAVRMDAGNDRTPGSAFGETGLSVRVVGDHLLVTQVRPGSPAAEAGLAPGLEIVQIGEADVPDRIERGREAAPDWVNPETLLSLGLTGRLGGEVGESVRLVVVDGEGEETAHELTLAEPAGVVAELGNLPPVPVSVEWRRVPQGELELGYLHFSAFLDPMRVMGAVEEAMQDFTGRTGSGAVDGVVIDMRGNIGGLVPMTMGVASYFVDEPGRKLGTMRMRDMTLNLALTARAITFEGPLAILVDATSVSSAEILAGGLQDLERGRVFGTVSAGMTLPSIIERLPNGDGFQYAMADYISAGGSRLEGRGVEPDEVVPYDRASLLAGRDPQFEAAAAWIAAQGAGQ